MSDRNPPSLARRAGRGLLSALRGLFGQRNLDKARESARALRDEFEAGKREAERKPPRRIAHEEPADGDA